jgi:hypothetical protein
MIPYMPICVGMSDCYLIYLDIVVVAEVQQFLPSELSPIIGDHRVGDPKAKDKVLDNAYRLFGDDFGQGPSFDLLSELVDHDKQVGGAPRGFFERSQEVWGPHNKMPCDWDGLELLSQCVDLPHKVLAPFVRPRNLNHIVSGRQLVKTLSKGFPDHAP